MASRPSSASAVELSAAGLTLGAKTVLMRFEPGRRRLAIDTDRDRCLALLSVACGKWVPASLVSHLEAASAHWQRGEPALANLRLVFARLPQLEDQTEINYLLFREIVRLYSGWKSKSCFYATSKPLGFKDRIGALLKRRTRPGQGAPPP